MEEVTERRKVINTLREMKVGDKEVFSIMQKTSVLNTISNRLYKERANGMTWSTKINRNNMTYVVTREPDFSKKMRL